MHIGNGFIVASCTLVASVALAHGPDGHEAPAASAAGSSTFLNWELLQAEALDARAADKMAGALQGMSGPEAAYHATYGLCVARLVGVLGDESQTVLLHQPGEPASYAAGPDVGSQRQVQVELDFEGQVQSDAQASWSIDWKPDGTSSVQRSGTVPTLHITDLHVPMAEVVDGTFLLATVGSREQMKMFNAPYETAKAITRASEDCGALGQQSVGLRKKAFNAWLKRVTSAN